jgi:Tfp pilus assembly protein PilV
VVSRTARRTVISRSIATKGFNLAEVMVAFMLIVIALFALISMQVHSMKSQTDSRESHLASVLAGSLLAEAEAKLESDFDSNASVPLGPMPNNPEFEAQVDVLQVDPELKQIKVEVRWKNGPSVAHRSVETTVARPYNS